MKFFSLDKTEGVPFPMLNSVNYMCAYNEDITLMKASFAKGDTVAPHHSHRHTQFTHILKGSAQYVDGDGKKGPVLHAGDTACIEPYEKHSLIILEDDTWVFDIFNPGKIELADNFGPKAGRLEF
ncbi:MAG: cupin domain-containing protein [Oscillospiraceae bacterium]|nr:cupin domain-containing protein [Oscillospiraceae bacterium]